MQYKCIFFDLDHTLWDYETNSQETLTELYAQYQLSAKGVVDVKSFCDRFKTVNFALWDLYDTGKITSDVIRSERFKQVLNAFGAYSEKLSADLTHDYLDICPKKGNLMPFATQVLDYLHGKYNMTIITNGFEEIQHVKMTAGNLHQYFDHIITSQRAGNRKPSKEIFDFALRINDIVCDEAIMIGDNLITDIGGSRNASIDNVFFNPEKNKHDVMVTHEIGCLSELQAIL